MARKYKNAAQREEAARRAEKRRKRKKRQLIAVAVVLIILAAIIAALVFALFKGNVFFEDCSEAKTSESDAEFPITYVGQLNGTSYTLEEDVTDYDVVTEIPELSGENLYSTNAYMIRLRDGEVIFDQGGSDEVRIASLTKMMTVLVAIEKLPNLEEKMQVTSAMIDPAYLRGASLAGFKPGEIVSIKDLMYGAILPSGAEGCTALANRVAGSEEAFIEMMNQKAEELSLEHTHFANCTGLDDEGHYSTCKDMAKLLEAALENQTFRTIITTHEYTTSETSEHPQGLTLKSTLFQTLINSTLPNGVVVEGGKTGHTDEALNCLASVAMAENGDEYVLVTAHAESTTDSHPNIADAVTLYSQL